MSETAITVSNLGDPQKEKVIHDRLVTELKECQNWRVSIRGSSDNDDIAVKVQGPSESKSWVMILTAVENQTVEKVVQVVMNRVTSLK